ncbi:hypothetical protein T08_14520 [Trichinella sp. T8]|nr:hypothetical protein T08_14520 [Trichinella sp. T8]
MPLSNIIGKPPGPRRAKDSMEIHPPKMTLSKFTGKSQFEANVHKRSDLDNATKFTYLLSNTEGTARNAIEGIPLTPENYTQTVDILI